MDRVYALLTATRLVTLLGPPGCGKTRLATQAARNMLDQFRDGVWLIELAMLSDPTDITRSVCYALDVLREPGAGSETGLLRYLESKHALLVFDDCEHLASACASLFGKILRRCAGIKILATSRHVLRVAGEVVWDV